MFGGLEKNENKYNEEDIFIEVLLKDYGNIINNNNPITNNTEYMQLIEFIFLLKNIRELTVSKLYQSFTLSGTITLNKDEKNNNHNNKGDGIFKRKGIDYKDLADRKDKLDQYLKNATELLETRLPRNEKNPFVPRIIKLCEHYNLSKSESTLIHLMTVVQGSTNPYVINTLIEEDYFKRILCFQRLADLSEADIDAFCDPERSHLKEGLVSSEEDHGIHFNLRCSTTCVKLLYGIQLPPDELLKVSQTALESIIATENNPTLLPSNSQTSLSSFPTLSRKNSHSNFHESTSPIVKKRKFGIVVGGNSSNSTNDFNLSPREDSNRKFQDFNESEDVNGDVDDELESEEGEHSLILNGSDIVENVIQSDPSFSSSLGPYSSDNQLEYLEDGFQVIAVLVRVNAARLKDDMRKEGTRMNTWDMGGEVKGGRRELQAKFSLLEKRMEKRLEATKAFVESHDLETDEDNLYLPATLLKSNNNNNNNNTNNNNKNSHNNTNNNNNNNNNKVESKFSIPRLEIIASRLKLDAFEKRLILLLIGKTVSPVVKALMDTLDQGSGRTVEDVPTVGQVLSILCQDFRTQIANRKYFYRSGRLLSHGIISLSKSRWHQGSGDLTDQRIVLDRRVLDWAVGLDSEINELVEGSDLYTPKVSLQQVVLPKGQLSTIVKQCRAYDEFRKYRQIMGLEDVMSYGNSLVILLCGKSGTGKTMTVNAIAHDLSKKVLLVDFGSLSGRREGAGDLDADLRGLFREAHMSNAVLFFDECEAVFRSRDRGGERLLNALLTEIERHEGIVFLATNRPHDLDEAMHRRITSVVQFSPPDYNMRLRIWESLLVKESDLLSTSTLSSSSSSSSSISTNENGNNNDNIINEVPIPSTSNRIKISNDVDLPTLSIKYELTGGFIKNALLSAMLIALNRRKEENFINGNSTTNINLNSLSNPLILTQPDLEEGCRLQMRGSLNIRHTDSKFFSSKGGLSSLTLSTQLLETCRQIIGMENSRTIVHGAWGGIGGNRLSTTQKINNNNNLIGKINNRSEFLLGEVECWNDTRRSTICTFAGPSGYGKRTLVRAIGNELKRSVQIVHISELLAGSGGGRRGGELADTIESVESLLQDARISDSVVGIDGFEHILDDNTSNNDNSGMKLSILLSRLLDIFISFPGLIILICHVDNPQNLILHKEFSSRIFSFIRFTVPSYEIRTALWRELIPPNAPLSEDIDFTELGRKFELGPRSISYSIARACSHTIIRRQNNSNNNNNNNINNINSNDQKLDLKVCQKDLLKGGEAEVSKLRSGNIETLSKMFL